MYCSKITRVASLRLTDLPNVPGGPGHVSSLFLFPPPPFAIIRLLYLVAGHALKRHLLQLVRSNVPFARMYLIERELKLWHNVFNVVGGVFVFVADKSSFHDAEVEYYTNAGLMPL